MALSSTFTAYDRGAMGSLTRKNIILKVTPDSCIIDLNTTIKFVFKIAASGLADDEVITIQAYGAKELDENYEGEFFRSMGLLAGETYENWLTFTGDGKYLFEYSVPNSAFIKFLVTSSHGESSNAVLDIYFRSHKDY